MMLCGMLAQEQVSVSIECARQVPFGTVHSVERSETAVKLIYKNKEKFFGR